MTDKTFYASHSEITDPGKTLFLFDGVSDDISQICHLIQGFMLHIHWAESYGISVSKERRQEEDLRKVERQLRLVADRSTEENCLSLPLNKRILGTCRDFSTILCSMLRHHHIPARPRCGFASYFDSSMRTDHWVCEYWDSDKNRWRMVDAQLDDFQRDSLNIAFDTTDIPKDQFMAAGEAWQLCREGKTDPEKFGIMAWAGLWFIAGNLVRDLLSLSKTELLPWDVNDATGPYENHDVEKSNYPLFDSVARLTCPGDTDVDKIRNLIKKNPILSMPNNWRP